MKTGILVVLVLFAICLSASKWVRLGLIGAFWLAVMLFALSGCSP